MSSQLLGILWTNDVRMFVKLNIPPVPDKFLNHVFNFKKSITLYKTKVEVKYSKQNFSDRMWPLLLIMGKDYNNLKTFFIN